MEWSGTGGAFGIPFVMVRSSPDYHGYHSAIHWRKARPVRLIQSLVTEGKDPTLILYCVGCQRSWCSLCSYSTITWGHWVKSFVAVEWGIIWWYSVIDSVPGKLNNTVDVLPWCLEAVGAWIENKRLQQDWVALGPNGSGTTPSLLWIGLHCPKQTLCAIWHFWMYNSCSRSRW